MAESRLHENFGLEVRSRDVRQLTPEGIDEIRGLLREHGVLLFRDQVLTDDDLFRISTSIGDGRLDQSADRVALSPVNAAISNLTNLRTEDNQPVGFGRNDTDYWHSDQEYRKAPATLASLYCLIPSPEGGDTSFAGTTVDTLGLDDDLVERLRTLKSTRRPAPTHDNVEHVEVEHPVVLANPVSGRESLYVSDHLIRFVDVDEDDSRTLKREILGRVLADDNIYRHQWRMGDLLFFDNTQSIHRREAFSGIRWLKATKIFAPTDRFAVPVGEVASTLIASQGAASRGVAS